MSQDALFDPNTPEAAAVRERMARLAEHPTIKGIREADERRRQAQAEEAARAAARPPLPPPLQSVEKRQQVQHREGGWVGTVLSTDGADWCFVKMTTASGAAGTAWFRVDAFCDPASS